MNEVVTYSYDAWRKLLSTGGSLASTVGAKNPYRYRGYRYDGETGLYYLQSRYYDPNTGRFLSADDTDELDNSKDSVLSPNLYAYCDNNPVVRTDEEGHFWNFIIGAVIGVGTQVLVDVISGKRSSLGTYVAAAFVGALSGGASAVSTIARVVGGAIVQQGVDNLVQKKRWNWRTFGEDCAFNVGGEILGRVGNKIAAKIRYPRNYSQEAHRLRLKGKYVNVKTTNRVLQRHVRRRLRVGKAINWSISFGYAYAQKRLSK